MSKRTKIPPKVSNGATILCNQKTPHGHCRKVLVTRDGNLRCAGGHEVSIKKVHELYYSRSDLPYVQLLEFLPGERPRLNAIRRLASERRLKTESRLWGTLMERPREFALYLSFAQNLDRKTLHTLIARWETSLSSNSLIARYLRLLKERSFADYVAKRTQILHHWGNLVANDEPEAYYLKSCVELEAATALNEPLLPLYAHNHATAKARLAAIHGSGERQPMSLFFSEMHAVRDRLVFILFPDSEWKHKKCKASRSSFILLSFRTERINGLFGEIEVFSTSRDHEKLNDFMRQIEGPFSEEAERIGRLGKKRSQSQQGIGFLVSSEQRRILPNFSLEISISPQEILEVMLELVKQLESIGSKTLMDLIV